MISPLDYKLLFENVEENDQYEEYLTSHISNVKKGYEWLKENLPEVVSEDNCVEEFAYYGSLDEIIAKHDSSKYTKLPDANEYYDLKCEYFPYADYFYGEKTNEVKSKFDLAWLAHIHANPHHWQHWMLQNDEDGLKILDMPYVFIIEMICDHWSFSWRKGDLREIFKWYEQNKNGILLSTKTRKIYENILDEIRVKLEDLNY